KPWSPDLGAGRKVKLFRHHADHRIVRAVELEMPSQRRGITAHTVFPESVTHDDFVRFALDVLVRKSSPCRGGQVENREEARGDAIGLHRLTIARAFERDVPWPICRDLAEYLVL